MPVFKLLRRAFIFSILLFMVTSQAATDHALTDQVRVRLIPASHSVSPGAEVLIGLELQIIPHWHTYWQNPGDSGMATSIRWQLPDGVQAGPIQWPTPTRFKLGSITNYGYANQVTLLSSLRIPESAKVGSMVPITAHANWLVCAEVCIPQQAELSLNLKVSSPGAKSGALPETIRQAMAALPQASPWAASISEAGSETRLEISSPELVAAKLDDIWFYPLKWGQIAHGAAQKLSKQTDGLHLVLQPGESPRKSGDMLEGVLVMTEQGADGPLIRGFSLQATPRTKTLDQSDGPGFPTALLLALLGGIILNLMPCVFPVLSIKALALVRHGTHASRETRLHGFAYSGGIVLSFLGLAGLLILLRSGGAQIGWGFQFQSPSFVLATAYLMFTIGLSLSGVFMLGTSISQIGEGLTTRPGYSGSFFTGVLAAVVATPCTAPFMGAAIGYALTQPMLPLLSIFFSLGLGLALPYLLLSNWPLLQRCLPRPGRWMERLKQFFAFPMYATAVWLVWVLTQQAGPDSLIVALGGMLLIAMAAWLYGSTRSSSSWTRPAATLLALGLLATTLLSSHLYLQHSQTPVVSPQDSTHNWETYSAERLQALREQGKPVFLNFTAAWCITCLANERIALSQRHVMQAFKDAGIHYLKADWTNQDAAITRKLGEFGRNGVPLYVFYPTGKNTEPILLPQILTPEIVLEHTHSSP